MTAPGKGSLGSVESWPSASLTQHMFMASGQASRRVSLGSEPALSLHFKINFYWSIIAFTMWCQFLLYNKVSQSYIYIYPLPFGFPPHLGHHRVLGRIPCFTVSSHQLSILFIHSSMCIYLYTDIDISMSVPISQLIPLPFPPLVSICLFSMSGSLFLLCK